MLARNHPPLIQSQLNQGITPTEQDSGALKIRAKYGCQLRNWHLCRKRGTRQELGVKPRLCHFPLPLPTLVQPSHTLTLGLQGLDELTLILPQPQGNLALVQRQLRCVEINISQQMTLLAFNILPG